MYEVELKAVLYNIESTLAAIETFDIISKEEVIYDSIYFEFDSDNKLTIDHKELRLRIIKDSNSKTSKTLLTYKDPPFDIFSRSKPEVEIEISNSADGIEILKKLGYQIMMRFEKRCTNINLMHQETELFITIAYVSELEQSFIEVESPTEFLKDIDHRFKVVRDFLTQIGIKDEELTNEYYTEAIMKKRSNE